LENSHGQIVPNGDISGHHIDERSLEHHHQQHQQHHHHQQQHCTNYSIRRLARQESSNSPFKDI